MRNINNTKLSRTTVLNKISQESIFSTYFNIDINIIKYCIESGELITSPIREDKKPTVGFRYDNKGRLKMKDFAGYFWGDCFDAVAIVLSAIYDRQYDVNNKKDFIDILRHITFTFKNIYYGNEIDPNIDSSIKQALTIIKRTKPIIEVVVREWNSKDEEYWNQFGINISILNTRFIYPVDQYYINRKTNPQPKYFYNDKDPCYCYNLGTDRNNINNIKLYFPLRNKNIGRFITNANHLEGIYNLDRNDYKCIIITKSTKDRLAIECEILRLKAISGFLIDFNIGVINLPHETYKLRKIEIEWLKSKLKDKYCLFSLMDNDETGINESKYIEDNFGITSLFIPTRYKSKDFAEFVQNTKQPERIKVITIFLTYYKNKRNELYRKFEKYTSLPF